MIKRLLKQRKKRHFNEICNLTKLNLDYKINKEGVSILEDIFIEREYSDYFPFYEKATILDVGAHFGYFSIFASRNTQPNARIFAIEPSRKNFAVLRQNLSDTECKNVTPFQIAIGEEVGKGQLFEGASMNNSLIEKYAFLEKDTIASEVSVIDLKTFLKENELESVDFLKMDCEGAEYGILLNAEKELLRKIKVISMEFHDLKSENFTGNRIVEKLKGCGFSIEKYKYQKTHMNLNFGKLIAIREEK